MVDELYSSRMGVPEEFPAVNTYDARRFPSGKASYWSADRELPAEWIQLPRRSLTATALS
jgi:hypothetical protein